MWIEDLRFDWAPYLAYGKSLTLRKNAYLFYYGERCEAVYVLLSGRIRLSLTTADGDERTFMVVGTHGLLGEAELSDVITLRQAVNDREVDEGWLVSARRISQAARDEVEKKENCEILSCYTFDDLLDQHARRGAIDVDLGPK